MSLLFLRTSRLTPAVRRGFDRVPKRGSLVIGYWLSGFTNDQSHSHSAPIPTITATVLVAPTRGPEGLVLVDLVHRAAGEDLFFAPGGDVAKRLTLDEALEGFLVGPLAGDEV